MKIPQSSPQRRTGTYLSILIVLLGAGLLVRAIHLFAIADTAFPRLPEVFEESDMHSTLEWARRIPADPLGRDTYHPYASWMRKLAPLETWYTWWGGKEIYQQAPLYPYFVAVLLRLFRGDLTGILAVQLFLGMLGPLIVFFLGRRLAGPLAGIFAAALTTFHGTMVFYQGAMLRDWLLPILEPSAILLMLRAQDRDRKRDWLSAGAAFGLAMLAKETATLLAIFACLWVLWLGRAAVRRVAFRVALVAAGFAIAISPLVVRNAVVGAPLLSVSNRKAEAIIMANVADARPIGLHVPPSMKSILERSGGRGLDLIRCILETYRGDWLAFFAMQLKKLQAVIDPFEVPNNLCFAYGCEISPVLRALVPYGLLLPLGLGGLFLWGLAERRQERSLLLAYFLVTLAGLVAVMVLDRYRLVIVPILAIYAGMGLASSWRLLRQERRGLPASYLGFVLVIAGLQHFVLPIGELRSSPFFAIFPSSYFESCRIYVAESRYDRAVDELSRLRGRAREHIRSDGDAFANTYSAATKMEASLRVEWAEYLLREGKAEEARRQARLAIETFVGLLDMVEPCYHLAQVHEGLGDAEAARLLYERFLEIAPADPRAAAVRLKIWK